MTARLRAEIEPRSRRQRRWLDRPRLRVSAVLPFLREIATEERRTDRCATVRHTITETREPIPANLVAFETREALHTR